MSPLREITERYRLEKIVKSTRSGSVLRATDALGGGTVAVKLVALGADPAADGERFSRFAGALAALEHPSLPVLRDFGLTTDGSAFLVMEHLEGRSVATLAGTDPKRILTALAPVAEGLALLASRGLSHGNLSPDNLFLDTGRGEVKMLGLGTALFRIPGPAAGGDNARFRAPEELAAQAPAPAIPAAADVYSFAAVLCYLLEVALPSGELGAAEGPEVSLPLSLAFQLEDVEPLRRFLAAAFSRRPEERPSLNDAREALQRAIHGAPAAAPTIEETRPAFFPDEPVVSLAPPDPVQPPAAAAPPAALAEGDGLPSLDEWMAAPALSSPIEASPAPPLPSPPSAAAAPPAATPPPPKIAIPEPPKVAIPEPPKVAIPAPINPIVPAPAALPEEDDELLTPITDDILEAMTSPPPKPAPPPLPVPVAASEAEPAALVGAAAWKARLLKPVPLAVAGAVLLLAVLGSVLWSRSAAPPPAVAAAPAAPPKPVPLPPPPPAERLLAAEAALAAGNDHDALLALRSITPAEQRSLPADACRQIQSLEEILALTAPARLAADLQNGWKAGNLDLLRMAARDAIDQPGAVAVLPAAARDTLDRARRASELYDLAEAAARKGDTPGTLEHFGELGHLIPSFHDGSGLREKAAAAVDAEAARLVKDARYEEALAKLEPLRQSWPDRPGLKAEVDTIRDQEKNEQTLVNLLAEADNAEKRRKPDEGIDLLKKVKPTPHLEAPYAAEMTRLQALLERVDGRPPTVEMRDGYVLDYDRGTVANLSFRIRDDYKVTDVKVFARASGGRMVELPYKKDGFVYDVAIDPSFHQNGTVDFYVVASDYSGHEGTLGSKEKPLQLKRRKGFRES
ncbi:MAG TPA: protein kinase [Thermoanaerobaculia bacterium]